MNNKIVEIRYGDVAPEAKENFVPSASESEFNTISQLQQYNLNFPNYANPCELYQTVLDGKAQAFPSVPESANLGLWSEQISNDDGTFTEPIVLELESAGQYSSQGLTLTFDTYNGIFATILSIKWLRITDEGITTIDEKEYTPDNASYFCRNFVENYNKVVITFYALNMPKNRLKLRVIDYGYGTTFYGNALKNVRLIQEIDPISSKIVINTADFTIDSQSAIEYSFQEKQPLSVYFNGKLKATTFVKSSRRQSRSLWRVQSEDYIGLLDGVPYYGGIYTNANAVDILEDIFTVAKVPYIIDDVFANATVTGYIPYTTCRNALMQVVFAICAVVDTSNSDVVKVFALEEDVKQNVKLDRIMQGQNFDTEETVTGVEVAAHTYKAISETADAYDATESGGGNNIFVKFNEPLHDLAIINGEIVSSGTNYAVINASENCLLTGQKYEHTTQTRRKNNPVVLAGNVEKIVAVEGATLVSLGNVDTVLEMCYNWLVRTIKANMKIVEKRGAENDVINVGDRIKYETEYLGEREGIVIRQAFNLNGGLIVKDSVIR